jgi:hypothetical protein
MPTDFLKGKKYFATSENSANKPDVKLVKASVYNKGKSSDKLPHQ